jgi:hypothetical protein
MPTLTFKVSIEEKRAIREAARHRKLNLSAYLRRMALPRNPATVKTKVVRSPRTGALVIATRPGTSELTSAQVGAFLTDSRSGNCHLKGVV